MFVFTFLTSDIFTCNLLTNIPFFQTENDTQNKMVTVLETYGLVVLTLISFERYLFVVYYLQVRFNLNDTALNLQRHTLPLLILFSPL